MTIKASTLSILFLWILIGCAPKEQKASKKEAADFAKKLELALQNRHANVYDSVFNIGEFGIKVAKEAGSKSSSEFLRGVKNALGKNNIGEMIVDRIRNGGAYTFFRQYEKDNRQHVMFRFYQGEGFNYHDYELVKFDDKIKAADVYDYVTGQSFTKSIADVMKVMTNDFSKKDDKTLERSGQDMLKMKQLFVDKKYEEAKFYYDRLPLNYKKEKVFQSMYLQIASELGDDVYKEALQDFEAAFKNDPSAQFALLDGYIYKQEFDKVMKTLDRIDSTVGGDPFLNYYRGLISNQAGKPEEGKQYLEKLHDQMPEFGDGTIELIASHLSFNEEEKAKKLIQQYKSNKEFDQSKLLAIKTLYPVFAMNYDF